MNDSGGGGPLPLGAAPTPDEVRRVYAETGSVRAAGDRLGITGARVHQILKQHGGTSRPLSSGERELLNAIIGLSRPVLRGPRIQEVAEAMNANVRSLHARIARLRKMGLVYLDSDKGVLVTHETRKKL